MKKLILVIGMPGAGKDTQIELLQKTRPINVIRVGDLIRKKAEKDNELSQTMQQGGLVDNEIVNKMVDSEMANFKKDGTIVSDGFPRDLPQAEWLDSYSKDNDIRIEKFIYLKITDEESLKRLLKRGRSDDSEKTIKNRIEVFHERTNKVLDYYKNNQLLVEVDGMGSVEDIHERMKRALNW